MSSPIMTINNLSFSYATKPTLMDISLSINKGEFVSIVGPNGAGKTTLLKLMAGLHLGSSGYITCKGEKLSSLPVKKRARFMAYVDQESYAVHYLTVYQLVLLGRFLDLPWHGFETAEDRDLVHAALDKVNMRPYENEPFCYLSQGEKQRVLLARALVQDVEVMLLDEPLSHVDIAYRLETYRMLKELCQKKQLTVIMTSHDLQQDMNYADRFIMLKQGQLLQVLDNNKGDKTAAWRDLFDVTFKEAIIKETTQVTLIPFLEDEEG